MWKRGLKLIKYKCGNSHLEKNFKQHFNRFRGSL